MGAYSSTKEGNEKIQEIEVPLLMVLQLVKCQEIAVNIYIEMMILRWWCFILTYGINSCNVLVKGLINLFFFFC